MYLGISVVTVSSTGGIAVTVLIKALVDAAVAIIILSVAYLHTFAGFHRTNANRACIAAV
jgi:hypothetical protein